MSVQILVACAASCDSHRPTTYQKRYAHFALAILTAHRRSDRMKWNIVKAAARRAFVAAVIAVIAALATPSAFAQTTGQVVGTIVDAQGGVLPGVTVSATSPQLQGTRTAVTDSTGTF